MKRLSLIVIILLTSNLFFFGQAMEFDYEPSKIRKEVRKIADKIGKLNEIHGAAISVGGERTEQYDRFEKIVKEATIEELLELMEHPKPAVRGYTFWGLAKRYYEGLEEVLIAHANDEEKVFQINGCIGGEIPVIDFMRWIVMPRMIDVKCKKLRKSALRRLDENREKLKSK
jgi:hypothetical protein